jgi:carbohydrate-binding DOMON domain-containing protein
VYKYFLVFLSLCLFCTPGQGSVQSEREQPIAIYFEASDPEGDDFGPGGYVYPRNLAFRPYEGLYDLLKFRVSGNKEKLFFDLWIKEISNPWNAPEGFIHPVINIYIDTVPGGRTEPLSEAMGVRMAPRYGWEICLEGVGWESSRLVTVKADQTLASKDLVAAYLPDQQLIRLTVPTEEIGLPQKSWRYYVLIGAYDGFGPGFLREIRPEPGDWHFGGAVLAENAPRVLDLLAREKGRYAQDKQLQPGKDGIPTIYPFIEKTGIAWGYWLTLGLALALGYLWQKRLVITGFWFRGAKIGKDGLPQKEEKQP